MLDAKGVRSVEGIVGSLLYISRAVKNKILMGLTTIGAQQANATEAISEAIDQLLNYVATYLNNNITYLVLCGHSDAAYLNKTRACRRADAYIFISKDDAVP